MATQASFDATLSSDSTSARRPCYVRSAAQGQVDILDHNGAALTSGVSVDGLVVAFLTEAGRGQGANDGWNRRLAAYTGYTGAAGSVTVTRNAAGDLTLTGISGTPTLDEPWGFLDAVLKSSGYQGLAFAGRWQAITQGRVN